VARYREAISELYQAPLARFVAERKRLAAALRAEGDREGASELLARKRPTVSAWAVNQLYWHARDAFDAMLDTAGRLGAGELAAQPAHREAIAGLRERAAVFLRDAGHAASEATLRRVAMTLAALAARGGFDPDPPGALAGDRDPPGFEAQGAATIRRGSHDGHAQDDSARLRARAHAIAEEQKRRRQEQHRLEAALRTARGDVRSAEQQLRGLEAQLRRVHDDLEKARRAVTELEARIAELDQHN
jgi:hypothetical protein